MRAGVAACSALLCALLAASAASARNGAEPLNHYGLVALADSAVGGRIAARFKAKGQPVFLVHDVNAGLSRNDIMRFSDRVVLVNDEVWSTLRAEGALAKLRASPIIRVQGRASGASWTQRAALVTDERQRKGFKLGAEILRALEENFGGSPGEYQLTLVFERGHLTLLASNALLDQLAFFPVRRIDPDGRPRIVSVPPDSNQFVRQPFEFRIWAVDPGDPAGSLTYSLRGTFPTGITWDAARHVLSGTPTEAGRWNFTAVVQNAGGRRDTLPFTLRFRANEPPAAQAPARLIAVTAREWTYAPRPHDADHPGYALRVLPTTLPRGMHYDVASSTFRWVPDREQEGRRHPFSFSVEDALGARKNYAYELRVAKDEGVLLTEGVKIDVPWDTLVRGRTYTWRTNALRAAWTGQNIRLNAITGSDSTRFENDTLFLHPARPGFHQLDFEFTVQGVPVAQSLLLPVRDDEPPMFLTEVAEWKTRVGEPPRQYRPIAVDPEGEDVTLTAEFPEGKGMEWDGRRILLEPATPGIYSARFIARDAGGKATEQWITFEAEKELVGASWILENHMQSSYMAFTATRDYGTGRVGVYTPNFTGTLMPDLHWIGTETPFFFIGGNLLGREAVAKGRVLWADLGFCFSSPRPGFVTGGPYLRLNGEWHLPEAPFSWIETEFRTHMHQALFATSKGILLDMLRDTSDIVGRDSLTATGPLSATLRNGFRGDNMRMFFRLEALGPVGKGFYAGPAIWRNDMPMRKEYLQWMGGALRYRLDRSPNLYQASFRVGWTPGGLTSEDAGWAWYATLRASLGSSL